MTNNEIVQLGLRALSITSFGLLSMMVKGHKRDIVPFITEHRAALGERMQTHLPDGVTSDQVLDALVEMGDARIRELFDTEARRRSGRA